MVLATLGEFAYNNAPSAATDMSPFIVCAFKHPVTPMTAVLNAASTAGEPLMVLQLKNTRSLIANQCFADMQDILKKAPASKSARQHGANKEAHKCKALIFIVSAQVSFKSNHLGINTLSSKNLFHPGWDQC